MHECSCLPFFKILLEYQFFPEMLYRMSEALTITKMRSFKHETFFSCSGGGGGCINKNKEASTGFNHSALPEGSVPQVTSVSTLDQPLQLQLSLHVIVVFLVGFR